MYATAQHVAGNQRAQLPPIGSVHVQPLQVIGGQSGSSAYLTPSYGTSAVRAPGPTALLKPWKARWYVLAHFRPHTIAKVATAVKVVWRRALARQ